MKYLILISLLLVAEPNTNQKNDMWATLSMITFDVKFDADWGYEVKTPKISPIVKALEGKQLEIEGYIIPLTGKKEQSHFMLSRYPQSMCFFCGKAGPESAMQIFTADKKKIAYSDKKITVKGILSINQSDLENPLYTLEEAVLIQ